MATSRTEWRSVFITGCSRGLGLEFIKQFLAQPKPPKHLIASCRNPENASKLQNLAKIHPNMYVLQLDVTSQDSITQAASKIEEIVRDEGLNLIINNAGSFVSTGSLDAVTVQMMEECFRVNAVAPLMTVKGMLPHLRVAAKTKGDKTNSPSPKAAIVNISSTIGSIADNKSGGLYPSRASKCAMNMLTKNLSIDLKQDGICAVAISPGWVKTDMGGPNAKILPEESVSAMLQVITGLDWSKNGMFFNFTGDVIEW